MKKILLALLLVFVQFCAISQKQWSNWYSDGNELITFKNGFAERVTNFINPIPPVPPYTNIYNFYYWGQGGISYSDSITGDMKFIISNRLGFARDYTDFPNDTFIRSCPDKFSYHIIPFHNDANKFYVIQFQSCAADVLAQETGLQVRCPNAIGLAYSIIDLSLNGGLGDISTINNKILSGFTEQITTVRHANGKDVWIIVHPYNSAQFESILVTDAGFQPGVFSTIGPLINSGFESILGSLTASHDGKMLAGYANVHLGTAVNIQLFDFDNATGLLSNYKTLPLNDYATKVQFSPDNSKLYGVGYNTLYQWDLNQTDVAASRTAIYAVASGSMYDMQLAPDGKIYISAFQEYIGNDYFSYLMAIQCPNLPQFACNLNIRALQVNSSAFPDLINDFINVPKVTPPPKFSIGNDTAICFGSYTITAPAGWQSYRWNTGDSTATITVTQSGLYYVLTGDLGFSCPTGYGYINVADKAVKLNLGKDTGLCKGTSYLLHVPVDYNNILWNNGSHTRDSLITSQSYCIISATDINGCFTKDTISIYYKNWPDAAFGNDTTLCNNETLKLRLSPPKSPFFNAAYLWQDGSVQDTFTVRQPGTYWGTVQFDGCTVSDTVTISYVSAQNVSLGKDSSLCAGDSLLLTSSIGMAKYLWSTNDTTQSIYVKNTGDYWVKVTNGLCTVSDTIHITFNPKPQFYLGNDTVLCKNDSLVLMPNTGNGSYLWQDGSSLNKYTVHSNGLYWLHFTQNGCTAADSINVVYKNLPPLNLGKDTGFCTGTSFILNAFNSTIQTYLWQDQSTQPAYTASVAGSYYVTVKGNNGCINRDTIKLTTVPLPSFTLGNDTTLCNNQILTYNFNIPNASYLWSNGNSGNPFVINSAGTYSLLVNQQGCSKTDSITVLYKPSPIVNLGKDTTLCENAIILLNAANNNATYKWQDASSNSSYKVQAPGLYFVTVNINSCVVNDSINISYKLKPNFSLGPNQLICTGTTILLDPKIAGVNYLWQDGSINSTYQVTQPGLYYLA
ncbi:MAG: hypothetical protein RIR31_806, partial [Bacteroidota bacterium]